MVRRKSSGPARAGQFKWFAYTQVIKYSTPAGAGQRRTHSYHTASPHFQPCDARRGPPVSIPATPASIFYSWLSRTNLYTLDKLIAE